MTKSVWQTLSKINVNDHTEKKNGLTYLSWAWAWGVLKENFPEATFEKHIQPNGMPYIKDENGYAYVQVSVTVEGISSTELFPVLDYRNKAIQNPDAFSINTAFQRGLAKAISYHGLGHYIYAGEDLPQSDGEASKPEVKLVKEPEPAHNNDECLGEMINTFAWKKEDKEPRKVYDWDSWSDVACAWINSCKSEKMLNQFYTANKKLFDRANAEAASKYEIVIDCIKNKKSELKEKAA